MSWLDRVWRFTWSKREAQGHLDRLPPEWRELVEKCAKAYIKGHDAPDDQADATKRK